MCLLWLQLLLLLLLLPLLQQLLLLLELRLRQLEKQTWLLFCIK